MEDNTQKQRLIDDKVEKPSNINNQKIATKPVSFFKLLCYFSKKREIFLLFLAFLGSAGTGFAMPLFSFIFGRTLNNISGSIKDMDEFLEVMKKMSLNYIFLGAGVCLLSLLMISCWGIIGKTLSNRIKTEYFNVIMSQEQGWFDKVNSFEFATKVQAQTKLIETGMGEKVGHAIVSSTMCVTAISMGFLTSWKLSGVLCGLLPLLAGAGYWITKGRMQEENTNRKSYEKAGGIAEETIYNIKTVASFCNLEYEKKRYDEKLLESMLAGIKDGCKTGLGLFFLFFIIYFAYTVSIWYGSHLIYDGSLNVITGKPFGPGDVLTVLLSVVFGAFAMGQSIPNFKAITNACSAAGEFFDLLDRKTMIENKNKTSIKTDLNLSSNDVTGRIEFRNITFAYPTATNTNVFNKFDLVFEPGKKTAVVGSSGSGKSTLVNLIEKLYDPSEGSIYLDQHDYKFIDESNLRNLIGYVAQEPVLFNYSIRENIIFGRENVTEEEINEAITKSLANEFVEQLPGKLDYVVGIKGSKLSGGQKQRIAIARAILRKPKILILDEATSALDNKSEKEIQRALNSVSQGITTIIIAHRLSTIINSDRIIVLDKE
jgi:ABC-type multidrug transport system fused ATPase/permease subunit